MTADRTQAYDRDALASLIANGLRALSTNESAWRVFDRNAGSRCKRGPEGRIQISDLDRFLGASSFLSRRPLVQSSVSPRSCAVVADAPAGEVAASGAEA